MYLHVPEKGLHVVAHHDTRTGAAIHAHGHHGAGHEPLVLPPGREELAAAKVAHAGRMDAEVGGVVDNVARVALEGDAGRRTARPAFAVGLEAALSVDAVFHPRSHLEGDALLGRVLHHLYLCNLGVGEVDVEIAQYGVLAAGKHEGNEPAMEEEIRAVAVEGKVVPFLEPDSHAFRVFLVMV